MNILVVGDAHACHGYDNDRFEWLGRYVLDTRPDLVLQIGDFTDLTSLCSYEKGKGSHEGRRWKADLAVTRDASFRYFNVLAEYNTGRRKAKKSQYFPEHVLTEGNHEYRAKRAENNEPTLIGSLVPELYDSLGPWDIVPFKEVRTIEGIACRHFVPNKMGNATSSADNLARLLLSKQKCSVIVGHAHILDYSQTADGNGNMMFSLVPGYFGHLDYKEGWAAGTQGDWWHGVVTLKGVRDGYPYGGWEAVPMELMKREYA